MNTQDFCLMKYVILVVSSMHFLVYLCDPTCGSEGTEELALNPPQFVW